MSEREALVELAADLRALSGRERRAVLGALSAAERSRLNTLLASADVPDRHSAPADDFDSFSPWLAARLRNDPDDDVAGGRAPWQMTAAARQLLRQAAQEIVERDPSDMRRGGSLLEALTASLLPRRRAR